MSRTFATLWGWLGPVRPVPSCWPPRADDACIVDAQTYARRRDPMGHWIHLFLAAAYLFALPFSTLYSSVTFSALACCVAIRGPIIWRAFVPTFALPMIWATAALAGWMAIALSWSPNPTQGLDEMFALRVLLTPTLLWPLLGYAPWLIGAALLGVFGQNMIQFAQLAGIWETDGLKGRYRGWIHPSQTGAWCTVAMCWHLSMLVRAKRLLAVVSFVGLMAAGAGLILCSSRGPWVASCVALPLLVLILVFRRPTLRRGVFAFVGVGLVAIAGAWFVAGQSVQKRITVAAAETQAAIDDHVYWTSPGLRVGQARWAMELIGQKPLFGNGPGSFRVSVEELPAYHEAIVHMKAVVDETPDLNEAQRDRLLERRADYLSRAHPHSTTLHLWLTQGVPGVLAWAVFLGVIFVGAWRMKPVHGYVDGTVAAIAVWVIGAQFDCYNLNGHLAGLIAFVAAMSLHACVVSQSNIEEDRSS